MQKKEVDSMSTVEERLASIETTLEFHGKSHESIDVKVNLIDSKLDALLISQAEKIGEGKAVKKVAALISGAISILISLLIAYFQA